MSPAVHTTGANTAPNAAASNPTASNSAAPDTTAPNPTGRAGRQQQPRFGKGVSPVKALEQLAGLGATGALTVVGEPGGVIFIREGLVNGAESPAAPSVDRLLTAAEVVDERVWETIPSRPARALVEGGHVTAAEIELCAIGALYDAAFFVLSTEKAELRFAPDIEHWLGAECTVTADQLCDHVVRQRRILDEVHPSDVTDTAAVRPVLRPGLDRVLLSGLQWEIVLHADGRRTPQELAGLLGRAAYAVTLDVRRLAAAGLVLPPEPAEPDPGADPVTGAATDPVPAPASAPESAPASAPESAPVADTKPGAEPAARGTAPVRRVQGGPPAAAVNSAPAGAGTPVAGADRAPAGAGTPAANARRAPAGAGEILPQRVPGTFTFEDAPTGTRRHLPAGVTALAGLPGAIDKAPDDSLLKRIRSALQSLR